MCMLSEFNPFILIWRLFSRQEHEVHGLNFIYGNYAFDEMLQLIIRQYGISPRSPESLHFSLFRLFSERT